MSVILFIVILGKDGAELFDSIGAVSVIIRFSQSEDHVILGYDAASVGNWIPIIH
jgi:hypothetical protein